MSYFHFFLNAFFHVFAPTFVVVCLIGLFFFFTKVTSFRQLLHTNYLVSREIFLYHSIIRAECVLTWSARTFKRDQVSASNYWKDSKKLEWKRLLAVTTADFSIGQNRNGRKKGWYFNNIAEQSFMSTEERRFKATVSAPDLVHVRCDCSPDMFTADAKSSQSALPLVYPLAVYH